MTKYIGIILFCSAISAYGAYLSYNISLAVKTRAELLSFIRHIESGIRYGSTQLYTIFSSFKSPLLEKCGFLSNLRNSRDIRENVNVSLYVLTESERNKVYEMLCSLGKSHYTEKELSLLSSYRAYFEESFEKTKNDSKVRALLYKKLGLIAALISAIILL